MGKWIHISPLPKHTTHSSWGETETRLKREWQILILSLKALWDFSNDCKGGKSMITFAYNRRVKRSTKKQCHKLFYSKILFNIHSCSKHYNPLKKCYFYKLFWNINLQKIPILTKIVFTILKLPKLTLRILLLLNKLCCKQIWALSARFF